MQRAMMLLLGVMLIAGGVLGASLTWSGDGDVHAQESNPTTETQQGEASDTRPSQMHAWMHGMMDQMMGDGTAERMHAAMPGSEAMMEACASGMGSMMSGAMPDMPMGGMRDGSE